MNLPTLVTSDSSRRIIGKSEPMQTVLRQVAQVAPTKATVLITGETGVGKDVIAQAIHEGSPRKEKPFKAVNCGTFYQELLQSELFGHERVPSPVRQTNDAVYLNRQTVVRSSWMKSARCRPQYR